MTVPFRHMSDSVVLWQPRRLHQVFATASSLLLVTAIIALLTFLSIIITQISGGITVIWPVEGVVFALMLGPFKDRAFAVLIVSQIGFLVGALPLEPHTWTPPAIALTKLGLTWLTFLVLRTYPGESKIAESKGLIIFIAVSSTYSLSTGVIFSLLVGYRTSTPLMSYAFSGTAMQMVGCTILTPLLLILFRPFDAKAVRNRRLSRTIAVVSVFCVLVLAIFAQSRYPLLYLIPLALMLVAYTVELHAVAVAMLLAMSIAAAMTLSGYGPMQLVPGNLSERIKVLQTFMIIISSTTLPIAALMAERVRLERSLIAARLDAEAANRAKSVFLATISHEIRTPLNGVLGMAQIMAMDPLSDIQGERLGIIQRSGQSLLALLNDVLDLSKIEAGKLTFETIDFDLDDILHNVVDGFASLAQEKGVALTLNVRQATGIYRGDPLRLRQIVYNLISNALKFTETGGISVNAVFDADGLRLSVADTGIGIPADKLELLFSKFNQVDESTTRRFGGTGLGLSICRELTELMGGTISVESRDGEGSTFTVTLPLPRVGDKVIAPVMAPATPVDVVRKGLRVLAAEDNAINQMILKAMLARYGAELTLVENGEEAVSAWETSDWDVILMDVQMPVMDGPTATRAIRARAAETARPHTIIIALTANILTHQIQDYLDAGMDGHLAKPVEMGSLTNILAAISTSANRSGENDEGRQKAGGPFH